MGIAKITDDDPWVVFTCAATSSAEVTAAGGTVVGSPTFDAVRGFKPAAGAGIRFNDMPRTLDYHGQIVFEATRDYAVGVDSNASTVTGSSGIAPSAAEYFVSALNGANSNVAILARLTSGALNARLKGGDSNALGVIHSAGKSEQTKICVWWSGLNWGIYADGKHVMTGTRTGVDLDNFKSLLFGGVSAVFSGPFSGWIRNIVVSRKPPDLKINPACLSAHVWGDSFVGNSPADLSVARVLDANPTHELVKYMSDRGYSLRTVVNGYSGFSMCNSGVSDLSAHFGDFTDNDAQVAVVLAFNNDVSQLEANITNETTGTEANAKTLINTIAANPAYRKVIIATLGSLLQNASVYSETTENNRILVEGIVKSLPAWWDAANPARAGFVEVFDLFEAAGGNADGNLNYQGALNMIGNGASTPPAEPNDRHLSGQGGVVVGAALAKRLLR